MVNRYQEMSINMNIYNYMYTYVRIYVMLCGCNILIFYIYYFVKRSFIQLSAPLKNIDLSKSNIKP